MNFHASNKLFLAFEILKLICGLQEIKIHTKISQISNFLYLVLNHLRSLSHKIKVYT